MKTLFMALAVLLFATPGAAKEQIAVIANKTTELASLNIAQAKDLFLGEDEYFPGGGKAQVADQNKGEAITQQFYTALANMTLKEFSVHWAKKIFTGRGTPPPQLDGGDEKVKEWVKAKANGLGYVHAASVDPNVKVLLLLDY